MNKLLKIIIIGISLSFSLSIYCESRILKVSVKEEGNGESIISSKLESNIISLDRDDCDCNNDGSIIIVDNYLYRVGSSFDFSYNKMTDYQRLISRVTSDDQHVLFAHFSFEENKSIYIYGIKSGQVENEFKFKSDYPGPVLNIFPMPGFSRFVYKQGNSLQFTELIEGKYINPIVLDRAEVFLDIFSAPNVNLLFYHALKEINYQDVGGSFLLRYVDNQWKESISLHPPDGRDIYAMGIDAEGKRIFYYDQEHAFYTATLNGEKIENETMIEPHITVLDRIQVSNDGNTFSMSRAREPLADTSTTQLDIFDLYIYQLGKDGQWSKTRLNNDWEIMYKDQFLMSKNGQRVYWFADTMMSGIGDQKYNQ